MIPNLYHDLYTCEPSAILSQWCNCFTLLHRIDQFMWAIVQVLLVAVIASSENSSLYQWKTPPANLARGLVSHGDPTRLRAAMPRWKSGSPLKLGFLGGSVTEGGYCYDGSKQRIQPFGEPHSWPDWTGIVLKSNLPTIPSGGGNVSISNGAISATSSDYFALCHSRRLPKDVDVIFL